MAQILCTSSVLLLLLLLTAVAIGNQPNSGGGGGGVNGGDHRKLARDNDVGGRPAAAAAAGGAAVRAPRFVQPNGLFGFFGTLRSIKKLYDEQYNDTLATLQSVMNTVGDQFTDTATKKPVAAVDAANGTATNTTMKEKYRISRQELGYILGKNYRGLRKLLRLELNDAANQSRTTISEYRRDFGRALSPYTIPKPVNATTKSAT